MIRIPFAINHRRRLKRDSVRALTGYVALRGSWKRERERKKKKIKRKPSIPLLLLLRSDPMFQSASIKRYKVTNQHAIQSSARKKKKEKREKLVKKRENEAVLS